MCEAERGFDDWCQTFLQIGSMQWKVICLNWNFALSTTHFNETYLSKTQKYDTITIKKIVFLCVYVSQTKRINLEM